jgi:hypothetical protein
MVGICRPLSNLCDFRRVAASAASNTAGGTTYLYRNAAGEYVSYATGSAISMRRVRFEALDVVSQQNAWAGIFIRRNEMLAPGENTNPEFIYETPEVRFASPLHPCLSPDLEIDIAELTDAPPAGDKLYRYLRNFIGHFLGHSAEASATLKLESVFEHPLHYGDPASPVVTLPPAPANVTRNASSSSRSVQQQPDRFIHLLLDRNDTAAAIDHEPERNRFGFQRRMRYRCNIAIQHDFEIVRGRSSSTETLTSLRLTSTIRSCARPAEKDRAAKAVSTIRMCLMPRLVQLPIQTGQTTERIANLLELKGA